MSSDIITELPLDEYMSCRSKFNGINCVHLAEYFVAGKSLCGIHYMVFTAKLFKHYYDKFSTLSIDDKKKREYVNKYILIVRDILKKENELHIFSETVKLKINYISYGVESYIYEGNLIKVYTDFSKKGDMRIFKKMDLSNYSSIENNRAKKLLHKFIPKLMKGEYVKGADFDFHLYVFSGVTDTLQNYIRYLDRPKINNLFIQIAEMVSKFHRKSIILGDISYSNLAMSGNNIIVTSFYSNTEDCDMYGRLGQNTKSNILCSNLITSSIDALTMKTPTKYSDLESIMWFYMQVIKHPLMVELETGNKKIQSTSEDTDPNSHIFSVNNIIKKKDKFIRLVARQNNLLQITSEGVFDIVDEVKRFIYFFD